MRVIIKKPEVTAKELANLLGVTLHRIHTDIRHRLLTAVKKSKDTLIPAEEVKRYLKEFYGVDSTIDINNHSDDPFVIIEDKCKEGDKDEDVIVKVKKLFLSINELADLIGVSYNALHKRVREGQLNCYEIGGRKLLRADDVKKFLEVNFNVKCILDIDLNNQEGIPFEVEIKEGCGK